MTWNIECVKPHQFVLTDILLSKLPDLVFLSEPQIFQTDIANQMLLVKHEYCYWLNSEDRLEPDLPLVQSKAVGGTLAMWKGWLDPYITVQYILYNHLLSYQ